MDHREPEPAVPRRFARLVPPKGIRKADVPWLLRAAGAALLGIVLLGYAGDWVPRQSPYRIPFHDIALRPRAPRWYRGGSAAFLEHVQANARSQSDSVSILNGDFKALADRFRLFPWVRSVNRVRAYPGQLEVELEYRTPVAENGRWLIDAEGILLPAEPVDRTAIDLLLVNLEPPCNPQPGKAWQTCARNSESGSDDPRAPAAGRLAAFLLDAPREGGLPPRVKAVLVGKDERRLFVQFEPVTRVAWGSAPGNENRDEPGATEKWQIIREWFRDHPEPLAREDFLVLSGKKLIIQHEPDTTGRGPVGRVSGRSADSLSR